MIAVDLPKVKTYGAAELRRFQAYEPAMVTGAPRGEKNGPALAVIGSASAISAGLSAGGLIGGIMMAGGVLGGLGAITGNKTLMTIGSIAGLAGGVMEMTGVGVGVPGLDGEGPGLFGGIKNFLSESFSSSSTTTPSVNIAKKITDAASTTGADLVESASKILPGDQPGVGSIFDSISKNSGLLGAISGAADSYMQQPLVDAKAKEAEASTDLINARADSEKQQQGLLAQRQANMQYQNVGNLPTVNQDANIYAAPGSQNGKYAVVINGRVEYVDQNQYAQLVNQGAANGATA